MTTKAMVKRDEAGALVLRTKRAGEMAARLEEESEMRTVLKQYIDLHMIDGVDFGTIPGTEKTLPDGNKQANPTLYQPGAEKLPTLFGAIPKFTEVKRTEDWDRGLFDYEFRCEIVHQESQNVLCEGMGSCNSWEARYRWRNAKRKCPECGKEQINRSKFPPRGGGEKGWYCHPSGGCGANFEYDDPQIVNQETGKVQNENFADVKNTILKMAKKRALVDASIVIARRYGFQFLQDVEDMAANEESAGGQTTQAPKATSPKNGSNQTATQTPGTKIQNGSTNGTSTANNDQGDSWEPPEQVREQTLKDLVECMRLANEYEKSIKSGNEIVFGRDDAFRRWCEKKIGRPIAINSQLSQLYQEEAIKLIHGIDARIAEKKKASSQP
jgi:predicted RNA-binding Zn-ribbon protein involved in translation (DUF1610 family)